MKQTMTKGNAVKSLLLAASLAGLGGVSTNSMAEMAFDGQFSGNVSATSTYLWRGQISSLGSAVQGGLNYNDQTGLHGGMWTSNALLSNELDIILGYSGKSSALSFDVGAIFYQYSSYVPDVSPENFEEIYANISQGQFSAQISTSSDMGTYFEVAGTFPVKSWDMTAHFGHYSVKDDNPSFLEDYADYNVSFKKDISGYDLSFMFSDTDMKGDDFRSIVTVTKNFSL